MGGGVAARSGGANGGGDPRASRREAMIFWEMLVGVAGFEPATPCVPKQVRYQAALHSVWLKPPYIDVTARPRKEPA